MQNATVKCDDVSYNSTEIEIIINMVIVDSHKFFKAHVYVVNMSASDFCGTSVFHGLIILLEKVLKIQ